MAPRRALIAATLVAMNPDQDEGLAIRVRGLRRRYGRGPTAFEAVRGLDFDVARGSITALLGTNGAGKTSALEVIEGLAPATAGEVEVLGLDPIADRDAVRARTGILLQRSGFSGALTVRETLRQWAGLLARPRPVEEMLALLALEHRAEAPMSALSGGETRRTDIACALMGDPELLILDEPTTGLDAESRRTVWELVRAARDGGATVVVTTHYLEEAETIADWVAIMHRGRIARSGTVAEIAEGHLSTIAFDAVAELPGNLAGVAAVHHDRERTTLQSRDLQRSLGDLLAWAEAAGVRLERLEARSPSLESIFLDISDDDDQDADTDTGAPPFKRLPDLDIDMQRVLSCLPDFQ